MWAEFGLFRLKMAHFDAGDAYWGVAEVEKLKISR